MGFFILYFLGDAIKKEIVRLKCRKAHVEIVLRYEG